MMKKGIILTLLLTVVTFVSASNQKAIDYYFSGELETAKALFLNTENRDAVDNYYLGMIAIKENNPTQAREFFNKGLSIDAENWYSQIGLATLDMKSEEKANYKKLKKIFKKNKRNIDIVVAVLEAFLTNNNEDRLEYFFNKATKYNKKSGAPYLIQGIYFENAKKYKEAVAQYQQAVYFENEKDDDDKQTRFFKIALARLAKLYVDTDKVQSFKYFERALEINPNYEYGWKGYSQIRYKSGFYPEAKKALEKYMELTTPTNYDKQLYGQILYFMDDYDGTINTLKVLPANTVINRLLMYSYDKKGNAEEAQKYANDLFNNADKKEIIKEDYEKYAKMLYKQKAYEKAGLAYEGVFELDTVQSSKIEALKSAGKAYDRAKKYHKAIELFNKVFAHRAEKNISMADYYSLAEAYRGAGTDTISTPIAENRVANLQKADSVYNQMTTEFPEHYLGYISRARVNSALDPTTTEGLAKPHYEKALNIMLADADNHKKEIREVYLYLAIHYLKTDKYAESKEYCEKILEIDPTNQLAERILKSLNRTK